MVNIVHSDSAMLGIMVVGMLGIAGGIIKYIFSRLDRKLNKDVFEIYVEKNDAAHETTHNLLKEIKKDGS